MDLNSPTQCAPSTYVVQHDILPNKQQTIYKEMDIEVITNVYGVVKGEHTDKCGSRAQGYRIEEVI